MLFSDTNYFAQNWVLLLFLMGSHTFPLDKHINVVYNGTMDNNDLLGIQQELPLEVDVLPTVPAIDSTRYNVAIEQNAQDVKNAVDMERELRKSELAQWASKQRIISNAPPTVKQLRRIHKKLKHGATIVKAIRKVCSYTTWQKWKEEYPEVAAMEEQARQEYVEDLLDKKLEIAQRPKGRMVNVAADKLEMDELQNRIDRIDRLTEIRNKKNSAFGGNLMPIQINVGYGKPKGT